MSNPVPEPPGWVEPAPDPHPVTAFARRLTLRLDELARQPLTSMPEGEMRESLVLLTTAQAQIEALQLRLLSEAETTGACSTHGAADAAGYLAAVTRQTRREARADLKLAQRLDTMPALITAMSAGAVNTAQARAIVRALDKLPTSGQFAVSVEQRQQALDHLIGQASKHDADELTRLGAHLFEVIAPDLAEAYEGRRLEAEEAKAARKVSLEMWTDDRGITHGRFRIPRLHGDMLRKAIWALTNPTRHATGFDTSKQSGIDPELPKSVRDGIAFTQILEALDAHWLPTHGGAGATIVVTMTKEQLFDDLTQAGVVTTDTGTTITVGEARRLACRAGIIPTVLGSKSVVLDAGCKTRFHTEPMRIAMGLRDGGCTAEECDVPAAMCHAHHDIPHSRGGPTNVETGRLLCGHHHRRIHDPAYSHDKLANGKIRFHRRT